MRRQQHGLTLIELLVALAVFAVLGTMTYRGTSQILNSSRIVEQDLQRWREIGRAMHIIETELLQAVAPQSSAQSQRPPPMQGTNTGNDESEINFLSLANPDVVERIAFRFKDQRLEWLRRPDLKPDDATTTDTLLTNVSAVRWRFLLNQGWFERWPISDGITQRLPAAIEVELTLPDAGVLRRIYALR